MSLFLWACFLAAFASFISPGFAQEALLEKFSQQEQESGDEAQNVLQELLEAPLDLNGATPAELLRLPFLSHQQIEAFISHRKTAVYYSTLEEALVALHVQGDTLALCRFVFKISVPQGEQAERDWEAHLRVRAGQPVEIDARWPGPKYRSYQRLDLQRKNIQAGVLLERDAGENRWDDHRAFYLQWRQHRADEGWKIILGNFQIEWGHGLTFWSPYRSLISSDVLAPARQWGRGARPSLSAYENASLYGGTWSRRWRALHILGFASLQKYDVYLRDGKYAVRYNDSGYHRSATEISSQKNLQENAWGGGLQIGESGRSLGLLIYTARYSHAWQADDPGVDYFAFTGKRNTVGSLTGNWRWQDLHSSFEIAASSSGGKAGSLVFAGEQKRWAWALAFHHAEVHFHSPHGLGPAAGNNGPAGNSGYEAGLTLKPLAAVTGEFYYQRTQNLWRTATLPFPAQRYRLGCNIEWRARAQMRVLLRYYRNSNEYLLRQNPDLPFTQQLPKQTESIRFELAQWFARKIRLRPRLDFARELRQQTEMIAPQNTTTAAMEWRRQNAVSPWGAALSLDFIWRLSTKVHFSFGQAIFDTAVPIYCYENDVPGVFTVQALRERGARRYIYLHLQAFGHVSLSGKIAETEHQLSAFRSQKTLSWNAQIDWAR